MERRSIAVNPRSTLFKSGSALQFAIDHRLNDALILSEQLLGKAPWAIYDVRRIYFPRRGNRTQSDPTKKGHAWRSVQTITEGQHNRLIHEFG